MKRKKRDLLLLLIALLILAIAFTAIYFSNKNSVYKVEKLMIDPAGVDALMNFADWKNADFENATSMGAGSLTPAPDENGKMDISERFIVNVGDVKYVLFVETLTSRWGMNNDGVSAAAATTFGHFDGTDYAWNGEGDDQSVLAGSLWWNRGN